jgi:hypothetical protein
MGYAVLIFCSKKIISNLNLFFFHEIQKENLGESIPKDKDGNRLYSDVHYLETYRVSFFIF